MSFDTTHNPQPSISAIIPTYNAGDYIEDALESIWNQTLLPYEIIVIDDASTDGTADRVESLAARSSVPLRLIRREENYGAPSRPTNEAIGVAEGDFICILDQDDVWLPTKLELQSRVLQTQPGVSFVHSDFGFIGGEQLHKWIIRGSRAPWLKWVMTRVGDHYECNGDQAFDLLVNYENFVVGFPGFMFRRGDWQERPGIDESFPVAADYDLLFWLTTRGNMAYIPQRHFLRREHDGNITHSEVPRLWDTIRVLTRYISVERLVNKDDYRRMLASKVVRLAQFFALCGHKESSDLLLEMYIQIRGCPSNGWLATWRRFQLAHMKWFEAILALTNLRRVGGQQATMVVEQLQVKLTDYGILESFEVSQQKAA